MLLLITYYSGLGASITKQVSSSPRASQCSPETRKKYSYFTVSDFLASESLWTNFNQQPWLNSGWSLLRGRRHASRPGTHWWWPPHAPTTSPTTTNSTSLTWRLNTATSSLHPLTPTGPLHHFVEMWCSVSQQVGTLDVLVGLSDELAKLDTFVER